MAKGIIATESREVTGFERIKLKDYGQVILTQGQVTEFQIGIRGSGDCQAEKLESQRATVKISGHGNVKIWAEETLDVRISGFGNVIYKGAPKVSQIISGAGSVSQMAL